MNRIESHKVMTYVIDNPGTNAEKIAKQFGVPYHTIKNKVKELYQEGKIFRQVKGHTYLLYSTEYAMENNIPEDWVEIPEDGMLEQQLWFNDLIRVAL